MKEHRSRTAFRVVCVTSVLTTAVLIGSGPLDPPAGPIAPTNLTLSELGEKIDELALILADGSANGPWEVHSLLPNGQDQTESSQLVIPGRVWVHSVTCHRAWVNIFDGPGGSAEEYGPPTTAIGLVGFARQRGANGTGGNYGETPAHIPMNVIVENGVYATWARTLPETVIQIRYRTLD